MRTSVQALCESLYGLQVDLNSKTFGQTTRPMTLLAPSERTGHMLELLDSYSKQKAS
jgi:hypothetical protein